MGKEKEKLKGEALKAASDAISLLQSYEQMQFLCNTKEDKDVKEFTVPSTPVCGAPVKIFLGGFKVFVFTRKFKGVGGRRDVYGWV